MKTIETIYTGKLRTEATHVQSGVKIITDAPVDNNGKGESFSPTDLLAASLGSCMLTIIGIEADKQGFNIDGTQISIIKLMFSSPRRVGELKVILDFSQHNFSESQKEIIKQKALNCPVAISLHPDILQDVTFNFTR